MKKKYTLMEFSGFNTRSNDPTVSITRAEAIGLSVAFCEENNVDKYKYAILYYDKTKNVVGFRLTNDESKRSKFAVTRTNKNKGKSSSIVAHTFFNSNKISVDKYAGKYMPETFNPRELDLDGDDPVFLILLEEGGSLR